jgi:hypothetical protein
LKKNQTPLGMEQCNGIKIIAPTAGAMQPEELQLKLFS